MPRTRTQRYAQWAKLKQDGKGTETFEDYYKNLLGLYDRFPGLDGVPEAFAAIKAYANKVLREDFPELSGADTTLLIDGALRHTAKRFDRRRGTFFRLFRLNLKERARQMVKSLNAQQERDWRHWVKLEADAKVALDQHGHAGRSGERAFRHWARLLLEQAKARFDRRTRAYLALRHVEGLSNEATATALQNDH